jgi:hypothetical protein
MKVGFFIRTYSAWELPAAMSFRRPRHYKYARKSQPSSLQKQQLKQPPLKMPAKDAGETSGTHDLRQQPISPEDTMYIDTGRESLNQYIPTQHFIRRRFFKLKKVKI